MIIHLFCFILKSFYDHTFVLFHLKILLWSNICFVSSENPSMIMHLFCLLRWLGAQYLVTPPNLVSGFFSILFDILFIVQHYVLYRNKQEYEPFPQKEGEINNPTDSYRSYSYWYASFTQPLMALYPLFCSFLWLYIKTLCMTVISWECFQNKRKKITSHEISQPHAQFCWRWLGKLK